MADHILTIVCAIIAIMTMCYCFLLLRKNKKLKAELFETRQEQEILIMEFESTVQQFEDSKEQLFQNNKLLKDLLSTIAHDIQSPLKYIHLSSQTLDELVVAKDFEKIDSLPAALKNSIYEILIFVNELSNWIKSIDKDYKLPLESVSLYKTLEEIDQFFDGVFKNNFNRLVFSDIHKNLNVRANKELLKIIIRNIIDNANKNSCNSQINVYANEDNEFCSILISDSGVGISSDKLNHVNNLLTDSQLSAPGSPSNSGHGYKLIAHFSKLLGISVSIESKPGKGTTVELHGLPILHRPIERISNNFTHP